MTKRKALEVHINTVDTLVLGSSHAKLGFDTRLMPGAFNLGTDNQDLYTAYSLLKLYIPRMKSLKRIILFYSLFSQGFELGKTKSYTDISLHYYIFNIPYTSKCITRYKRAYLHRIKKFNDSDVNYQNFFGYLPVNRIDKLGADFTKNRVAHHLRENTRRPLQHEYLDLILKLCADKKIKLSIVIAPVREDFIQELSKDSSIQDLFQNIYDWTNRHKLPFQNYFTLKLSNDCFKDCDHLNSKGAEKLTGRIIHDLKIGSD